MPATPLAPLVFPSFEFMVQSRYLYAQCAGSTAADGSTWGEHVRWLLTRNLGDTHMPKGDAAANHFHFNRRDDYVTLLRSRYVERYPTILDFSVPPKHVNDALAFWIYTATNTSTVVYVRFRDAVHYANIRAAVDPKANPQEFVRQYCPHLIEVEVPDKLFFAAEIDAVRDPSTILRTEALSVEENVPLSPLFVSCRHVFTHANWCPDDGAAQPEATFSAGASFNCIGPNLFLNGGFEPNPAIPAFAFETDYSVQKGIGAGIVNVTADARTVNGGWVGLPRSGESFLTVDGHLSAGKNVVRARLPVKPFTTYSFSGWLATLYTGDVSVPIEIRIAGAGAAQTFQTKTPTTVNVWEQFAVEWKSGNAEFAVVSITSLSTKSIGNDFGLDDLSFCESAGRECRARIRSENIRSIRFTMDDGYPRALALETYQDYMAGTRWETLDRLALTLDDATSFQRLELSPGIVEGRWPKFNEMAFVNAANYRDRWLRQGGLKEGVQQYITLSNTDPKANATLAGGNPEDGSIRASILDALQMVSLDFHVARMFGLGYVDRDIESESDEYVYLAIYDTEGPLDDKPAPRLVRHYFMTVPTRPIDHRLPERPVLKRVTYGLDVDNGESQPSSLTDENGYTPDGVCRFVNLFVEPEEESSSLNSFFVPPDEFCAIDHTSSIFYGVEYRKDDDSAWRRPEIAHDENYKDTVGDFETLPLPNQAGAPLPILRHEERENGVHEYAAYGINWFSRASGTGNVVSTDFTFIVKAARLLPPSNFAVQLIQQESPLLLTTAAEQAMLSALGGDKTLVRVTFDYDDVHDVNYAFADTVELFFRSETPRNVAGALKSVADDPADARKAVIRTKDFALDSQGTVLSPTLDAALFANFIGGVFTCQQENYIITAITASSIAGEGPVFTVQKNVAGNAADPGGTGAFVTVQDFIAPQLTSNAPVMFMAVENMASAASWGAANPLSATVALYPRASQHIETIVEDGQSRTISLRGVHETASVTALGQGIYRIAFTSPLAHHPQHAHTNPVDWYKGVVRIARAADPNGPKKVLDVQIVQHIGDGQPLVVHALDEDPSDAIQTGSSVTVNYYPGYCVYLHADAAHGFDENAILAAAGEGTRRTWLGARATDSTELISSPIGIPAPIIAVEDVRPLLPGLPRGAEYATWPDFYYKSSYTFRIAFAHEPFSIAFYRSNDTAILRALYSDATFRAVRDQLDLLGEDDPHRADRWRNIVSFDYIYDTPGPDHPYFDPTGSSANGTFRKFPAEPAGYAFPNPDKPGVFSGAAPGSVLPALREAIHGAFTALTELPLLYQYIKDSSYVPVPKAQNIRDSQGRLLDPSDPEFHLAPMAKRTGTANEIQFTDFTLDGTGNNVFFYCGREIGNRGRLGDAGPIAGPVQLVNTRPPDAPAVKRMFVREPNPLLGMGPVVQFEVNAYPEVQKVKRMLVYRTTDPAKTTSVRTMDLVKTVDLEITNQTGQLSVSLADDFEDGFIPYGDPLYYRLVAERKINKPDGTTLWAPSQASKLLLTTMIDTTNPEPPLITFTSDGLSGTPAVITNVALSWSPTVYNGTYYLARMTSAGTWRMIYTITTNDPVTVNLAATDFGTNTLPKEDQDEGRPIYNRFRVQVENSSGLFNLRENVLTI